MPYFFLTCNDSQRKNHMYKEFDGFDITHINCPEGDYSREQSAPLGFSRILDAGAQIQNSDQQFKPFVLMEDDIKINREIPDMMGLPDNTDLLYIGRSVCGMHKTQWSWDTFYRPFNEQIDRVYNMLSLHGVVICSVRGMLTLQKCMMEGLFKQDTWDIYTAQIQPYLHVYVLKDPLVYQFGELQHSPEYGKEIEQYTLGGLPGSEPLTESSSTYREHFRPEILSCVSMHQMEEKHFTVTPNEWCFPLQPVLKISNHPSGGFFSCCSVILASLVHHHVNNNSLPPAICTKDLFMCYKTLDDKYTDIYSRFFKLDESVNLPDDINFLPEDKGDNRCFHYNYPDQLPYESLDYDILTPLIHRYFQPSDMVKAYVDRIMTDNSLDVDNTCVLYYRGLDKHKEYTLASYNEYINKVKQIQQQDPDVAVLIQTPEQDFLEYALEKLTGAKYIPTNKTTYKKHAENLHHIQHVDYEDILHFNATVHIMSKCKYIITGRDNTACWLRLLRGNCSDCHVVQ